MRKRLANFSPLVQTEKLTTTGNRQTERYYVVSSLIFMVIGLLVGDSSRSLLYNNSGVP
jgi:hypothetical protein